MAPAAIVGESRSPSSDTRHPRRVGSRWPGRVGLGQGGDVVEAVTDHADPTALGLQPAARAGIMIG